MHVAIGFVRQFVPAIIVFVLFGAFLVFAWTGPTAAPPNNNVDAPINVGTTDQIKDAGLGVNALAVFGNTLLSGSSLYLNFGPTAGSAGYGIRDNSGTIEFKNSGGNWTVLGSSQWITNGTSIYYSTGNVGINTTSPSEKLSVVGNVVADGYFHNSDERLKENIRTIGGLDIVSQLRGVSFNWKKDGAQGAGVIAQEVEQVLPEVVHADLYGTKSVDYDALIAPLIEAIKEQQAEIDALKAEIEALKQSVH